jgi:PAS domain S-box-containing protein
MELVEQAIVGILLRRPDGQILMVNDAYCRLTGYDRHELLKMKIQQVVSSIDAGVLERTNALRVGESTWTRAHMLRKDGSDVYIEANTHRLPDGNLQSTVMDITGRHDAEQSREASEQRYAELVDQALEGITVRSPTGDYLFVNDTFCRMLGYSRAEVLRLNVRDLVHLEDIESVEQVERLNKGGSLRLVKRMRHKDGHIVHVEVSVRRLQDGNFQNTIQDISEHKRSEERFQAMVEGSPTAMLMVSEQGSIAMANAQAERLFGFQRRELLGKPVEMLVPEPFRVAHPGLRAGFHRDPKVRLMGMGRDLYARRKDGSQVPVEIGLNPIVTGEGGFVLASIIDISQRREAEQRERAYMEELRLMSQRLLEAQETERRAIARELHDEVGQALTATGMLLRDLEQQPGVSPLAAEASGLVVGLLKQVRQLSLDLHPSVLDDLGLAAALRWVVRTRTVGGDLQVTLELDEDLPRFTAMIENTAFRVFQESISNILRHAAARSVRVTLKRDGDTLELTVQDDGRGFDPAAAGKHALEGKSLGVLGMRERVRLAGGRIELESSPGAGTRVQVWLPALERTESAQRG